MADMNLTSEEKVARLLAVARQGDGAAVQQLCDILYQDLRQIARSRLRNNTRLTLLDTTALVHESFLRLVRLEQMELSDRIHFLGYASRVMRSVVIDFIRMKKAERRGGDLAFVTLSEEIEETVAQQEDDAIRISESLDELASVDPRAAQVVEMRYFAGMTEPAVAAVLGVTERTVRRDWEKAKLLLKAALN